MWWCVLLVSLAARAQAAGYLLPGDVRPAHYAVRALYDIDPATNFSFFGVVDIVLHATKPTSKIILHAQDYTVDPKDVTLDQGPKVTGVTLNDTYNLLTVTLDDELETRKNYTLTIPFYGNLRMGLDGVYISSYKNKNTNAKEYLITTQFEAISARKGFPCFDEPMYKATFSITLGHSKAYNAVSNMPLMTSSEQNGVDQYWPWSTKVAQKFKKSQSEFVWDEFANSVPMSTYLVAFVVSKFKYTESPAGLSTTKFKIWSRSDAIEQTSYAANIGPRVLDHFEKFFSVPFPLPKQDMVAIPDFSAGAMENWGLITYRETALLYDKEQSSFLNKERVAEVIAHELAHQWFGNLVTMKWWSDLWLNEGFATFMASVGVAAVEPAWEADRSYAVDNIMRVLSLDSLESSHPVSVPIDDPKRIGEIFDEISYSKGSTLIRMMTMFLGQEVFREAIHNYLTKYSYQNAEQDDLWSELTSSVTKRGGLARDASVKQVMDTWTTQTGYPLLTVTRDYADNSLTIQQNEEQGDLWSELTSSVAKRGGLARDASVKQVMDTWTTQTRYPLLTVTRDYADNSLTIQQKRYLSNGARSTTTASWWVPLQVLCEGEAPASAGPPQWLAQHEGGAAPHRFEHAAKPDQWVLFNYDMIAPYRVNYDKRNWELLSRALASERYAELPVLGRVQLLSDAFALAWTDQLDYTTVLELASYLRRERNYLPISTGLKALAKIENVLKRSADYGAFQKYVRRLITDTYVQAGGLAAKKIVNGDDLLSVKMQVTTSGWACRMHVPGCEEHAVELFQSWMRTENPDEENPIPLDLRRTVYCVALSRGGVREWRFALGRMQRANVAAARDALLAALACTREVWILTQYLEWAVTEGSEVRRQDAGSVIQLITRSSVGFYVARDFIYTRIQDIHNTFKGQTRRLGGIIKSLLDQFTTQRELDDFMIWFGKNEKYFEEAKLSVQQAIEKATVNIEWARRHRRRVVEQLREYST